MPAEGRDWMTLGLGSAGRRPGLKLEVPVESRDSSLQSGTSCRLGVGCASRDSAGGMVAGEDEETDGDEVADEGVAVE